MENVMWIRKKGKYESKTSVRGKQKNDDLCNKGKGTGKKQNVLGRENNRQ